MMRRIIRWADWAACLEVVDAPHVCEGDAKGVVEFKVYYRLNGVAKCMHERSCFKLIDSRWYLGSESFRLNDSASMKQPKIGRNEPCLVVVVKVQSVVNVSLIMLGEIDKFRYEKVL